MNKETVSQYFHGQVTLTANTVTKIINLNNEFAQGILLRCPGVSDAVPNTTEVWVGKEPVTDSDGMALAPGETLSLPLESGENLYAVTATANQVIAWMAM
jgi:hypothetical protein